MSRLPEKDLYSILGVTNAATPEMLRAAYLARARIIHPDRFDRQQQPQDWKKANDMLAELNEAYSILRNPSTRAHYDDSRGCKRQQQKPPPSPRTQHALEPPPAFESGELTTGQAVFGSLPNNVQSQLLKRQLNKGVDQFQVKLSTIAWNYIFIVVLLCWYCYLFATADGAKWKYETLIWYTGITLVVGVLIGRNCITIRRWNKSKLKPYFYVTPIYFIKTEYDIVTFRPIWTLKDISVTHNYKNGSYRNTDVVLKFDGYNESINLSSRQQVEALFAAMSTYDTRSRIAYNNRDYEYFHKYDDFSQVPRAGVPTASLLSKRAQAAIYIAAVFVCGIGFYSAVAANKDLSRNRWVRHPTPSSHTLPPPPSRIATPSYPEQALPYSGEIRAWTSNERVAPFEIKAAQGSNHLLKLVDAYSYAPVMTVFVRSGSTVEVDVPLGTYEVRYASGETWYGYEYLFGPDTSYNKADKHFTFQVVGNQISGFTITLYKVAHGNLHTSKISAAEF